MSRAKLIAGFEEAVREQNFQTATMKLSELASVSISKITIECLTEILVAVLPKTYHSNTKLRMDAENVVYRLNSLIAAFYPITLLEIYRNFESQSELKTAGMTAIFNCLANSLKCIPPNNRLTYIGTCHCMLMGTKPAKLRRVTMDIWKMLRKELTLNAVQSVIELLLDSPLANIVAFLCEKDPETLVSKVIDVSGLQFVKEFIRKLPGTCRLEITMLKDRIIEALSSESTSQQSLAIEIAELMLIRDHTIKNADSWREIWKLLENHWEKAIVSQKADLIRLFSRAASLNLLPIEDMRRFLVYNEELSDPLPRAIIKVSELFVMRKEIPAGMLEYYESKARDRSAVMFIIILKSLKKIFNCLYEMRPKEASKILHLCMDPLPAYYVEQSALVSLLRRIDYEKYSFDNVKDVVYRILQNPHQMVLKELALLISEHKIDLPYSNLDWFENASGYLTTLRRISPSFVLELIDYNIIQLHTLPVAWNAILENTELQEVAVDLLPRALALVYAGMRALDLDLTPEVKSLANIIGDKLEQYLDPMAQMLQVVETDLSESTFGQIIQTSMLIIERSVGYDFEIRNILGLLDICCLLGIAFTEVCSKVIAKIGKLEISSVDIQTRISKFFKLPLQFNASQHVVAAAVNCKLTQLPSVMNYMIEASEKDRDSLIALCDIASDIPLQPTFLALRSIRPDYVNECTEKIPFGMWHLLEEDEPFFEKKDIKIEVVYAELDETHQRWVDKFPECFLRIDAQLENMQFSLTDAIGLEMAPTEAPVKCEECEALMNDFSVPFDPYQFKTMSESELFMFLWFSSRDCEKWSDVEEYVMKKSANTKLVAAFFAYAHRKSMTVDVRNWAPKLRIARTDRYSVMAVAFYLGFVETKWDCLSPEQQYLIKTSLMELGVDNDSEYQLTQAYFESPILTRMLASAVIQIDRSRFGDSLIMRALFDQSIDLDVLIDDLFSLLEHRPNEMVFNIISSRLFALPKTSEYDEMNFPEGVGMCRSFVKSSIEPYTAQRLSISGSLIDKILSFMERCNTSTSFFLNLLDNVELSPSQNERFLALVSPGHWMYHRVILSTGNYKEPTGFFGHFTGDSKLDSFITTKPPSYSRRLLKSLSFISDFTHPLRNVRPVFGELLFPGYDVCRDIRFPEAVTYDEFRHMDAKLQSLFEKSHSRLHCVISSLLQLDEARLSDLFHNQVFDMALGEFASEFIISLETTKRHIYDTIKVTRAILGKVSIDQLMPVFMGDHFLNTSSLCDLFIIVKLYLSKAEPVMNFMRLMENKIQDPERLEILRSTDVRKSLAIVLHPCL